jgi:hypothetical protein
MPSLAALFRTRKVLSAELRPEAEPAGRAREDPGASSA